MSATRSTVTPDISMATRPIGGMEPGAQVEGMPKGHRFGEARVVFRENLSLGEQSRILTGRSDGASCG